MLDDFNDVEGSRTTEQAKSLGALVDSRIGRWMFNTFLSNHPLLRYLIDHMLVTSSLRVARLSRLAERNSKPLQIDTPGTRPF